MANNLRKATKLVDKASNTFIASRIKVEQANILLNQDIENDGDKIKQKSIEINNLKKDIENIKNEQFDKKIQIEKNDQLINHLDQFIN